MFCFLPTVYIVVECNTQPENNRGLIKSVYDWFQEIMSGELAHGYVRVEELDKITNKQTITIY